MKNWEDKIKEKLEGYESVVPEERLAQLYALIEADNNTISKKRSLIYWALPATVAAGLAAILLLNMPENPESKDGIAGKSSVAEAQTSDITEYKVLDNAMTQSSTPSHSRGYYAGTQSGVSPLLAISSEESDPAEINPSVTDSSDQAASEQQEEAQESGINTGSQTINATGMPSVTISKTGAGITNIYDNDLIVKGVIGSGAVAAVIGLAANVQIQPSNIETSPLGQPEQDSLVYSAHYMPLKLGFSTGITISDRLFMTAGIEYAKYSSLYVYSLTGDFRQSVQYLNFPVRMNYEFTSTKYFDIYAGVGIEADVCVKSMLAGKEITQRDGISLLLLCAGGAQINLTKDVGLYVEPELSWQMSKDNHVLTTYRTEHPLMFSVSTGIRINIGH